MLLTAKTTLFCNSTHCHITIPQKFFCVFNTASHKVLVRRETGCQSEAFMKINIAQVDTFGNVIKLYLLTVMVFDKFFGGRNCLIIDSYIRSRDFGIVNNKINNGKHTALQKKLAVITFFQQQNDLVKLVSQLCRMAAAKIIGCIFQLLCNSPRSIEF